MLDIKIDEEHIRAVEDIIPKIPAKINEVLGYISGNTKRFHERLERIEQSLVRLEQQNGRTDDTTNGNGSNGIATAAITNTGTE